MKLTYAIDCANLQRRSDQGPDVWLSLISQSQRISKEAFEQCCSVDGLLDEGELLEQFISDDPGARFMKSKDGHEDVYFLCKSGFEFFFTAGGRVPDKVTRKESDVALNNLLGHDASAVALLPRNDPRNASAAYWEHEVSRIDAPSGFSHITHIQGDSDGTPVAHRLVLFSKSGEPVAGITVCHDLANDVWVVDQLYTHPQWRRQGLATELFETVNHCIVDAQHSDSLTALGELFVASFHRANQSIQPTQFS